MHCIILKCLKLQLYIIYVRRMKPTWTYSPDVIHGKKWERRICLLLSNRCRDGCKTSVEVHRSIIQSQGQLVSSLHSPNQYQGIEADLQCEYFLFQMIENFHWILKITNKVLLKETLLVNTTDT